MQTEDQSEVIGFLEAASTHGGATVERIDTHASVVFLAGSRAWKLKRAVRYEFLDFSTAARRREMCEAELRISQRISPGLYRGVTPVTRGPGELQLGGPGDAVDWVIEMVRFDQDHLFDRLAERGALPEEWMTPLAAAIASAHAGAERLSDRGGVAGIRWVIDGNEEGFAEPFARILDSSVSTALTRAARAEVDRQQDLLESRRIRGFVRRCHGDLHLRNIVLLNGQPTLFDAIEFNDAISCIDVLYDVAFLVMDLWHRGLRSHANRVLNAYVHETGYEGLPLLPLYLSCRAAVRAKTESMEAELQHEAGRRAELEEAARQYLALADDLLRPRRPRFVAIGGLSGTGKSTLAQLLAPSLGSAPGAVVLRSDEIRKRLCGVGPLDRLGPQSYTTEVSARVYGTLAETASSLVSYGHAVIVDAVFARLSQREAIERLAETTGVPFVGLWLDAPESTRLGRVETRRLDASDAEGLVVRDQSALEIGPVSWERIDASLSTDAVRQQASSRLEART
jgi:aminoglycoside phosphotransferase family enzyme/predicted kinase